MPNKLPHDIKKINDGLYTGTNCKIWRANGDWKFKTFGRSKKIIEGRASDLKLAMASVSRCI